ncbi:RDD family protein [Luteimonas aquatica]|uniref:RDD family protein n=1 Tax=Luteimonas aquatica TaxID=450364 RepID=UPI001F598E7D|nr:RDD family protein [Luteimonas aquatica]
MLDTFREVHTPEGVALQLPAAGPVPRALAWLIDAGIRLGMLTAVGMLMALLGTAGMGLYLIVMFLLMWAYPVVCEAVFNGQTPGKRALELRVVSADGAPVGWMASIVRNLMRTVDMLPFAYGFGVIAGLADPYGRRLGDLVAGTLVVHAPRLQLPRTAPSVSVHAPAAPLRPGEQVAVIAFAERATQLTAERQRELADIVEPVTGARGELGVVRLAGIAAWLLGRR